MVAIVINVIILITQIISYIDVFPKKKLKPLKYYTQLSNICAAAAAILFLILGDGSPIVTVIRYNATCMLTLTFIVVLTILIPVGEKPGDILWKHHGFLYHVATPVMSFISYCFFETHVSTKMMLVPTVVTLVYGILMLILNGLGKITGPYPFLEVRKQSKNATVLWIIILVVVITVINLMVIGVSQLAG